MRPSTMDGGSKNQRKGLIQEIQGERMDRAWQLSSQEGGAWEGGIHYDTVVMPFPRGAVGHLSSGQWE